MSLIHSRLRDHHKFDVAKEEDGHYDVKDRVDLLLAKANVLHAGHCHFEVLLIVHILHSVDSRLIQVVVTLLWTELVLLHNARSGSQLEENMKVPFYSLLEDDSRFFQEIIDDAGRVDLSSLLKVHLYEFPEPRRVVIFEGLRISKRLQQRV